MLNAREIAELLSLKKSNVENAIKALKKKGVIYYEGSRTKGGYIAKIKIN